MNRVIKISIITIYFFFLVPCILADANPSNSLWSKQKKIPSPLSQLLNDRIWNELFPNRYLDTAGSITKQKRNRKNDFYSFQALKMAADYFPNFLSGEDRVQQKRELCAFLANIAYETGAGWAEAPGGYYNWGLFYTQEKGCEKGCPNYSDPLKIKYPPQPEQSYHGRGPLQLSWNYNYGQFSEAFFGTKDTLLLHPDLVAKNPVISFASAIWFWITPQVPKPSCHDVISDSWKPTIKDSVAGRLPGFGTVVNVINGGIECGKTTTIATNYRLGYYLYFCRYFKVSPGENISCSGQRPFGQ